MSLARAFTQRTKRTKRPEISLPSLMPARAMSMRKPDGTFDRGQISGPVQLLSTTNVLAYEAPDIHPQSPPLSALPSLSSSSSMNSYDSDGSSPSSSSNRSGETTTDASSIESPPSPEPNHLSCYFQTSGGRSSTLTGSSRQSNSSSDSDAPAVPSRAPSHTKKSHQAIARKRSMRMSPPPTALHAAVGSIRSSLEMFSSKVESNHPFGAELEKVNELAEEFSVKDPVVLDEEEEFLIVHGLRRFGAEEYVFEIQGLFGGVFEDSVVPMGEGWI